MKSIKVMPDYECHALWHHKSELVGDIDPHDLPISDDLAEAFDSWAIEYDKTLNFDDPGNSKDMGFKNKIEFAVKGYELAIRLKRELKNVEVVYFDIDQIRERII